MIIVEQTKNKRNKRVLQGQTSKIKHNQGNQGKERNGKTKSQ